MSNGTLKKAFQKAQCRLVNSLNPASAIDHLFANEVISDDDMQDLRRNNDNREKCRHLLALLHSGGHPQAFIELRLAIKQEPAYDHLIKEIDCNYRKFEGSTPAPGNLATCPESNAVTVEGQTKSAKPVQESDPFSLSQQHNFGNVCHPAAAVAGTNPVKRSPSVRDMNRRLRHALCGGLEEIRSDVYPLLVLPQCGESITKEVLQNSFKFLDVVPWRAVFDFDNGDGENAVYRYMDEDNGKNYIVTTVDKFDLRVSDNKEEKKKVQEAVTCGTNAVWLFCNGYGTTKKEVVGLREWKLKYSWGCNEAIKLLAQCIPQGRALVVILSLSKCDEVMYFAVESFCSMFDKCWVAIAEDDPAAGRLVVQLGGVADEQEVRKRCIVGMPWVQVNDTITGLFDEGVAGSCQLITSTGARVTLSMKMKNTLTDFEIISCDECDNSDLVKNVNRMKELNIFKANKEKQFYRGQQVDWWNFYFHSHVLRRDLFGSLFERVTELLEHRGQPDNQLVGLIRLCHQPSAGGTTIAKGVLWDLRARYRCAVVKRITDWTCDQLFELRSYKDKDNPKPVLLLLDNISEDLVNEFVAKLVDRVKKSSHNHDGKMNTFCVLLICQSKPNPVAEDKEYDFVLRAALSRQERIWLTDKYKQLEEDFRETKLNDPQNLISFNVMKQNFNKNYMQETVSRYARDITDTSERQLLKYLSLISKFNRNRYPIPVSSFDSLISTKWEANISGPLKVLLHETESKKGEEHTIRIINSALSEFIYAELTGKNEKKELEADVMIEFLNTNIFTSTNSAVDKLLDVIRNLMKNRERKVVDGRLIEDNFSPLIKAIVEDEQQSVPSAVKVLDRVFEITEDLFVAQQIARLYINVHNWAEAIKYGEMITKTGDNSYLLDTLAQVYKEQLYCKVREGRQSKPRPLSTMRAEEVLAIAFQAIDIFQKGQKVSDDEKFSLIKNNAGHFGEIKTSLLLLEYLSYVDGLQDANVLRKFLIKHDFIPEKVECWRRENRLRLKELEKSVSKPIACLEDEFFQLQLKTECFSKFALLKHWKDRYVLYTHKEKITTFFCDGNGTVPQNYTPVEAADYYRRQVRRLGGDTLRGLLDIRNSKEPDFTKLSKILDFVQKNIGTRFEISFDLKVYLGVSLVLCTHRSAQSRQFSHKQVAEFSSKLYEKADVVSGLDLEPFFYAVMFNWPRKNTTFAPSLPAHCLSEVLRQWKQAFGRKYPRRNEEKKKETTFFFLGNGVETDAFAYGGELEEQSEKSRPYNEFWSSELVKNKLERLTGVLHRKHNMSFVTLTLKQDGNEYEIEIPTALPVTDARKLNKLVSFYLGFQWSGPKAFGVGEREVEDDYGTSANVRQGVVTAADFDLTCESEFPSPGASLALSFRQSQKQKCDKKRQQEKTE